MGMTLLSDTFDVRTGRPQTRWQEAQVRLKEMVEIIAYVPFTQIDITFLNRPMHVVLTRNGRDPHSFLADANRKIDQAFAQGPRGSTPALEKIQSSLINGQGKNIARYFFGDGIPNGGKIAQERIIQILCARDNPEGNPVTFLSCTNEDDQVEWMKDAEEIIPYCSESDDFDDEAREVLRDQGTALPYSKGFHLICQLVAAMNPDDLDAMDESVPFTKRTLDNILGIEHNEESYRYYFNGFVQAQRNRRIEGPTDQLKKSFNWEGLYQQFLTTSVARQIPSVQEFNAKLKQQQQPSFTYGNSTTTAATNHASNNNSSYYNNSNSTNNYNTSGFPVGQQPPPAYNPAYNGNYTAGGQQQQSPPVVQGVPTSHNNNIRKKKSLLPRFGKSFQYPGQRAIY